MQSQFKYVYTLNVSLHENIMLLSEVIEVVCGVFPLEDRVQAVLYPASTNRNAIVVLKIESNERSRRVMNVLIPTLCTYLFQDYIPVTVDSDEDTKPLKQYMVYNEAFEGDKVPFERACAITWRQAVAMSHLSPKDLIAMEEQETEAQIKAEIRERQGAPEPEESNVDEVPTKPSDKRILAFNLDEVTPVEFNKRRVGQFNGVVLKFPELNYSIMIGDTILRVYANFTHNTCDELFSEPWGFDNTENYADYTIEELPNGSVYVQINSIGIKFTVKTIELITGGEYTCLVINIHNRVTDQTREVVIEPNKLTA